MKNFKKDYINIQMLLMIISFTRALLAIVHYFFLSSFVSSRPPGRKMVNVLKFNIMHCNICILIPQVTSDINVYATFFGNLGQLLIKFQTKMKILSFIIFSSLNIVLKAYYILAIFSMSFLALIYSIFGYLPSALIFMFTQIYITSVTLFIGVLNISSFLQVSIITNQQQDN